MSQKFLLSPSTAVEPLIHHWYAYPYSAAPATASLHAKYQLTLLRSFLADPKTHYRASQDKEMMGGPFVQHPPEMAPSIRSLLDSSSKEYAENLDFARALLEFQGLLHREARGQNLDAYYERLPEPLRGRCELIYDYYNHPIVRVMEPTLYRSTLHKRSLQSLLLFEQRRDDQRKYCVNTPRFSNSHEFDWAVPFDDPRIDQLFELESRPKSQEEIGDLLRVEPRHGARLQPFLVPTEGVRRPPPPWAGPGVRVRYFGHACVLVEAGGVSVLTDPNIALPSLESPVERLSYRDLPERIDFVLVTHAHFDHYVIESLLRLRHKVERLIVPRNHGVFYGDISLKHLSLALGFRDVVEIDELESVPFENGEIVAVPFLGEHGDLANAKTAYLVRVGKQKILFAADSNCLDRRLYGDLRRDFGDIASVFLGMECVGGPLRWFYGDLLEARESKESRDLERTRNLRGSDAKTALALLDSVGARRFYVYAMGLEPWLAHILTLPPAKDSVQMQQVEEAIRAARSKGMEAECLFAKFERGLDDR